MTTVARLWLQVNQPVYFIVAIDTGETVENYQFQRFVRSLRRPKGRRRYGHFDIKTQSSTRCPSRFAVLNQVHFTSVNVNIIYSETSGTAHKVRKFGGTGTMM